MKKSSIPLLTLALIALPFTGRAEGTNETASLFGITVTQTVSKAQEQFELGYAHQTGDGVEQDLAKAIACYKVAAELGHAQAQFNLGICCMQGTGVEQSEKEAAAWLRKAADQELKEAYYPLGICHYNLENYTEAYAWALFAEAGGDTRLKEMFDPMYTEEEMEQGKIHYDKLKKALEKRKEEQARQAKRTSTSTEETAGE